MKYAAAHALEARLKKAMPSEHIVTTFDRGYIIAILRGTAPIEYVRTAKDGQRLLRARKGEGIRV